MGFMQNEQNKTIGCGNNISSMLWNNLHFRGILRPGGIVKHEINGEFGDSPNKHFSAIKRASCKVPIEIKNKFITSMPSQGFVINFKHFYCVKDKSQ